jgi:large subunit ribosomal protein L21
MSPCPSGATSFGSEFRYTAAFAGLGPAFQRKEAMTYAIIKLGGKQHRVREGEWLLVDRLKLDEGKTFNPDVLLVGGDGNTDLAPTTTVTARVVGHELGEKIRIGKYKKRTGYRRHNGHRSRLTRIEIEAIGAKKAAPKKAAEVPGDEPKAATKARSTAPAAPKAEAPANAPARAAHPPKGYEDMSIAEIKEHVSTWRRPNIEAALEYEKANANRKGAIATLVSALGAKEEH